MPSNPRQFNQHRTEKNKTGGVIKSRIDQIIWYVIDCYLCMLEERPQYSILKIKGTTTYKFEDYITSEFVENYLTRRVASSPISQLNEVIFNTETTKKYIDTQDLKEKPNKIDIYITNLQLDNELCSYPKPYFAIECKRILTSSSFNEYITDIKKFSDRIQTRLPYEGQIAYIENPKYPHKVTVENINKKLKIHKSIKTIQYLTPQVIHEDFEGSYISKHLKEFGEGNVFAIHHLMFDFTKMVID